MLRETRARWLAMTTTVVVLALVALFAGLRNRDAPGTGAGPAADRAAALDAFEQLGCGQCHRFEGRGNGLPLDGVGTRRDAVWLRDHALGEGRAHERLPADVVRIKQRAAGRPEVETVVALLGQARQPRQSR